MYFVNIPRLILTPRSFRLECMINCEHRATGRSFSELADITTLLHCQIVVTLAGIVRVQLVRKAVIVGLVQNRTASTIQMQVVSVRSVAAFGLQKVLTGDFSRTIVVRSGRAITPGCRSAGRLVGRCWKARKARQTFVGQVIICGQFCTRFHHVIEQSIRFGSTVLSHHHRAVRGHRIAEAFRIVRRTGAVRLLYQQLLV